MFSLKYKNKALFWSIITLFTILGCFIPICGFMLAKNYSEQLIFSIIGIAFVLYLILLVLLNFYHWSVRNETTLSLLIVSSIFCLLSVFTSFICVIVLFCCRKKLKENEQIQFKLIYEKSEKNKLNAVSWFILFSLLILMLLNAIPYTNKIIFSSGLGFIPSFFLIQLVTLVTVKLIVHIAYLIMCSKTYKVKNVLKWKLLDLITLGYVWSSKYIKQ